MSWLDILSVDHDDENGDGFRIYGAVTGIVGDLKDPEGLGRIKVDFPWLADASEDTVSIDGKDTRAHSYWARPAMLMAGPKRGTYFLPELDDEVLVVFEHGILDRPYIIGVLWNRQDMPPEQMDKEGKNHIRSIHTRSGHKLTFNDSDDASSIKLEDNTGKNYIAIDTAQNAMTIKVDGDLTIDAGGQIIIKAGQQIDVEAGSELKVKAGAGGEIKTGMSLDLKADLNIGIKATAQTKVSGKMVAVDGAAVTEIKGGIVKIN